MMNPEEKQQNKKQKKQPFWLIYLALIISGVLLLGKTYSLVQLNRWTAQLGVALIFSAFALIIGNGRIAGYISVAIVLLSVIAFFSCKLINSYYYQ